MKIKDIDFRKMLVFQPEEGRLLLGSDRMLLFRQDAFATLRKLLIEQLGEKMARVYLSQFGYRCGAGDYKALSSMYPWDTEADAAAAGTAMHMWEGIVHVTTTAKHFDKAKGEYHMKVLWRNSYEGEVHKASFGASLEPVCHTMTGYASGYASAFLEKPVIAIEQECVGKGDAFCTCELRVADQWGPEADPWKEALNADVSLFRELQSKSEEIGRYQRTLSELRTPIIQIWDGVVVVPVVGVVDVQRSVDMMESLLHRVARDRVRCVIFDMTGVEVVDSFTADHIFKMVTATNLLGAFFIITGIRPEVARALVHIGLDMSRLATRRTLKEGLEKSFELLGYTVVREAPAR